MGPEKSAVLAKALLASGSIIILAQQSVWALPFHSNPQSFQQYANSANWNTGGRIYFQNLYSCAKSQYKVSNENSPRLIEALKYYQIYDSALDGFYLSTGGTAKNPVATREGVTPAERSALTELWDGRNGWWSQVVKYRAEDTLAYEKFRCQGYVTLSDPRGTKVCEATVSYDGREGLSYSANSCIWK